MPTSPSDEYTLYLRRCASVAPGESPLTPGEFEVLLRRLDDLYLLDLERHLAPEERTELAALAHLLKDDLGEVQAELLPVSAERACGRFARVVLRRPKARIRRALWRECRRPPKHR